MKNDRKQRPAGAGGDTYDSAAIDMLKGLESGRKPWDGLMYDPNNPGEIAAIRARIAKYLTENPNEQLPPEIAAFMARE